MQIFSVIHVNQLASGCPLEVLWQFCRDLAEENLFCFFGGKGLDHPVIVSSSDNIVKRYTVAELDVIITLYGEFASLEILSHSSI